VCMCDFRIGANSTLKASSAIDYVTNRPEPVTATGSTSSVSKVGFRTHSFLIQNNGKKNTNGSSAQTARESKVFVLEVQSNCSFESKLDSIVRLISTKRNAGNSYPPLGMFNCCGFKVEILPRSSRPVHIPYSPGRQMKVQSLYAIRIRVTPSESLSAGPSANSMDSSSLTLPKLSGPFLPSSGHASAAGISAFGQLKMSSPPDASSQSVRHCFSDAGRLAAQCKIGPFTEVQTVAAGPSSTPSSFRPKPSILCSSKSNGSSPAFSQGSASARLPLQTSTPTFQQQTASSLALPTSSTSAQCLSSSPGPKLTIAACFSLSSSCSAIDVDAVDLTGDCDKVDRTKTNLAVEASDDSASTGGVGCEMALSGNSGTTRRMEAEQDSVKTGSVLASDGNIRLLVPHSGPRTSISAMLQLPAGDSTTCGRLGSAKLHRINIKDWNDLLQKRKLRGQRAVSEADDCIVKATDVSGVNNDVTSTVAGSTVESNGGMQYSTDSMPSVTVDKSMTSAADAKPLATDHQLNRMQQNHSEDTALNCVSSTVKSCRFQSGVKDSSSDVDAVSTFKCSLCSVMVIISCPQSSWYFVLCELH
jgi:hypothetical protein